MASLRQRRLTPEEYLTIEEAAEHKSEYISGEMFGMSGGSPAHGRIAVNLTIAIGSLLKGRDCQVFNSDIRIKASEASYFYPDLSVVCDKPQFIKRKTGTLINPAIIVEVLSELTEAFDRGEKFAHYRRLESLSQYVLVSQNKMRVEWFYRGDDGDWRLGVAEDAEGMLAIPSIGCEIALSEIYDRVDFDAVYDE